MLVDSEISYCQGVNLFQIYKFSTILSFIVGSDKLILKFLSGKVKELEWLKQVWNKKEWS